MRHLGGQPWARIWPKETGMGVTGGRTVDVPYRGKKVEAVVGGRKVTFGIKGGADLDGLLMPDGRRIEIECKTGKARQTKQQRAFETMIGRFGGLYYVVRSTGNPAEAARQLVALVEREVRARGWTG